MLQISDKYIATIRCVALGLFIVDARVLPGFASPVLRRACTGLV